MSPRFCNDQLASQFFRSELPLAFPPKLTVCRGYGSNCPSVGVKKDFPSENDASKWAHAPPMVYKMLTLTLLTIAPAEAKRNSSKTLSLTEPFCCFPFSLVYEYIYWFLFSFAHVLIKQYGGWGNTWFKVLGHILLMWEKGCSGRLQKTYKGELGKLYCLQAKT